MQTICRLYRHILKVGMSVLPDSSRVDTAMVPRAWSHANIRGKPAGRWYLGGEARLPAGANPLRRRPERRSKQPSIRSHHAAFGQPARRLKPRLPAIRLNRGETMHDLQRGKRIGRKLRCAGKDYFHGNLSRGSRASAFLVLNESGSA